MTEKFGPYPVNEYMIVLEGAVTIIEKDRRTTIKAGENFILPKGLPCQWHQDGYMRKFFVIFDDPSGMAPADPEALSVLRPDPRADLSPSAGPAPELLLSGTPQQRDRRYFADPTGQMTVGVWSSTPYHRKTIPFPRHELMHILEGEVTITEDGQPPRTFKAGDTLRGAAGHAAATGSRRWISGSSTASSSRRRRPRGRRGKRRRSRPDVAARPGSCRGQFQMDHVSEAIPAKSSEASEASRQLQLLGAAMVVVSTASIAIVPTLARLAYDGGTNTMTVITARSVFSAAVCFVTVILLRRQLRIPRRALAISLGLRVLYAIHLYSLLAAVTYLPVNMVVLIYFLHPLMIGIAVVLTGQQKPSLVRLGALAGAIVGLGLAVGFSLDNLSFVGMALAFLAAVIAAGVIACSSIAMKDADSFVVVYYMMLAAALVLTPVSLVQDGMALPTTSGGSVGFTGVAIAYTIGTLTFFGANSVPRRRPRRDDHQPRTGARHPVRHADPRRAGLAAPGCGDRDGDCGDICDGDEKVICAANGRGKGGFR